jgi:hypothetical protein
MIRMFLSSIIQYYRYRCGVLKGLRYLSEEQHWLTNDIKFVPGALKVFSLEKVIKE